MSRPTVVLELAGHPELARDLAAGGVFVPGCATLAYDDECELVLRGAAGELAVPARCVWVDAARGAGLQLLGFDARMKAAIAALALGEPAGARLAAAGARDGQTRDDDARDDVAREHDASDDDEPLAAGESQPDDEAQGDDERAERKIAANVNERLRGLTLVQQLKLAHHGELAERVVLERLYGKNVWEALLRNPRITGPEVARIARMGSLPRPLVELIVGNGAWLAIPEVRRALLSNTRLGADQVLRVLRLLPKHELKLAAMQTAYPLAVRDAAKRMLKDAAGG